MPGELIPWCCDNYKNNNNNTPKHSKSNVDNNNNNNNNNPSLPLLETSPLAHHQFATNLEEKTSSKITDPTSSSPSSSSALILGACWQEHIYWKRPLTIVEDLLTKILIMGSCLSTGGGAPLIDSVDGDEKGFHERYMEDRVLGEGEFGVVTLVHDMQQQQQKEQEQTQVSYACKTLRKGVVFKDNTLYAPLKPEVLKCEVEILRTLNGEHYNMQLIGVYETPRVIYMVTEYCAGGEMMEYVSKQEEDLRTDDVSRIAFQMLDAVNHCAKHNIIHRDIKPENVMFQYPTPASDLRLIDFGSGTNKVVEGGDGVHTTFAGSAFYISPEMFQRTYTQKTDVWSVGVTLYVLVAGYPAEVLQKAFNILQKNDRNLRDLPNFPDNMPNSFYDMLEGLLVYRHKRRKTAGEMLDHEFVQFHNMAFSVEQIAMEAQQQQQSDEDDKVGKMAAGSGTGRTMTRMQSVSIKGSVGRHSIYMDYQKYQRSLTTLLATLLDKGDLQKLLAAIGEKMKEKKEAEGMEAKLGSETQKPVLEMVESRLIVIPVRELKSILEEQKQDQVLAMIAKLPGSNNYNTFAYEVSLLKDFSRDSDPQERRTTQSFQSGSRAMSFREKSSKGNKGGSMRRSSGTNQRLNGSFRGSSLFGGKKFKAAQLDPDSSVHSTGSLRGRKKSNNQSTRF